MNVVVMAQWVNIGMALVSAGLATAAQVRQMMALGSHAMTEAELDAILDAIADDAKRRELLAAADKAQAEADAAAGR